jgi:endoglucanase
VIYEIFNEPERQSWGTVKTYANSVIAEIRKYDPDNLIVVGSPNWSQDVDVAANSPISGTNIAYSFHFYGSDPAHQWDLRSKANTAISKGLALFVTEWGVSDRTGDGAFNEGQVDAWVKWMDDNKLSWCNWSIADKTETSAALRPGASTSGNWTSNNLTASGAYVRDKLRQMNSGYTYGGGGI